MIKLNLLLTLKRINVIINLYIYMIKKFEVIGGLMNKFVKLKTSKISGGWNNLRVIGTHPNPQPKANRIRTTRKLVGNSCPSKGREKRAAFTLAEVLITLAIVGVVAAMTIPTLIAKINDIVTENQVKVFKSKVVKGLNLTKTAGDMVSYDSTYDFLTQALSKHLKIAKICDSSHMRDCVPYDEIKYMSDETTEDVVEVKDLNTSAKLNLSEDDGFKDVASFVLGDGTVVIASYKLDCLVDTEELDKDFSPCFAGLYDLNGTRKPNKLGKDLLSINSAGISVSKGTAILATIGGVNLISTAQVPTPMKKAECEANKSTYGIKACHYESDYWAGAVKQCQDAGGRLPTAQELADIATALYGGKQGGGSFSASDSTNSWINGAGSIGSGEAIPEALSGLGSSWYYLWSSGELSANYAHSRGFNSSGTLRYDSGTRLISDIRAVCVVD